MQEPNRDIFPTPAMLERFPNITPLLKNEAIEAAFNRHEALSVSGNAGSTASALSQWC